MTDLAGRIAARLAGSYPLGETYHFDILRDEMPEHIARAQALVEDETGLRSDTDAVVEVVDRAAWAERNIDLFGRLVQPIRASLDRPMLDTVVRYETAALLGALARRVLGQYEMVLPGSGDVIYLVAPNVLALERGQQFVPDEFRLWVALHEVTHRLQFVAVPWMRDHFIGLVEALVAASQPDPDRIAQVVRRVTSQVQAGGELVDETGLLGLFASERQREELDRVQALMSVLEGHGHVLMDRVGAAHLPSQGRMTALIRERRADPKMRRLMRLTGMELKIRQYEIGERFVLGVENIAGWDSLEALWEGADNLPSIAELERPRSWLARVA